MKSRIYQSPSSNKYIIQVEIGKVDAQLLPVEDVVAQVKLLLAEEITRWLFTRIEPALEHALATQMVIEMAKGEEQ